ncbi:DNA-binding protein [Stenotrophomonas pictorum JCM 9942]|uniref:DNA-binding protein n=1 Tax=Stenotrophomonas pictorum JCM 9942 TaxID=1236960 RepID=A0A0R0AAU2_9GAMM|nr:DNA-binding protein [Stenotrophomonas pictorum JCM 9942]
MSIDLSHLSAKELAVLIRDAQKRKTLVAKRQPIAKARAAVIAAAKKAGYTIEELFGTGAPAVKATRATKTTKSAAKTGRKLPKVAPKYRNPANAEQTWTGRGKQPRWLAEYTGQGRKVEDFLIQQ